MNKLILISTLALILVVSQTDGINIVRHILGDQRIQRQDVVDVMDVIRILRDEQSKKMKEEEVIEKTEDDSGVVAEPPWGARPPIGK